MKSINKVYIYITGLSILLAVLITSGIYLNSYLSKVIITKPFSVIIKGISRKQAESINIFGYSPTGKMQRLDRTSLTDKWEYTENSNFKNLFIFLPDSLKEIQQIIITSKNKEIIIKNIKRKNSNICFEITDQLKVYSSKSKALFSLFYFREVKIGFSLILFALISLIVILFFINKIKTISNNKKGLWIFYLIAFTWHILFHVFTGNYLITTGIFVIWGVFILFYFMAMLINYIMKIKMQEIQLVIISIAVCFSVLEIIFILSGFKSTWQEKRNIYNSSSLYNKTSKSLSLNKSCFYQWSRDHDLSCSEFSFHRTINSDNFSDIEHNVNKKESEFRILGIGDSFTEGDGADTDSTWLKFLERSLKKDSLKKEISFFNAGVSGSDPFFEYFLLKGKLLKYKPDLVILSINNSDVIDIIIRGGFERFLADGSVKLRNVPWWEPIYTSIHISRLIFDNLLGYNELLIKESESINNVSKEKILEAIYSFNDLACEKNFKLLVIFNPMKNEVDEGKSVFSKEIFRINKNTNIEVLDLLKYYNIIQGINSSNSDKYFWKYDGHHNAKGYELFAKGVEWKLKEMGIIDSLKKK